jgi:hypothetical protein
LNQAQRHKFVQSPGQLGPIMRNRTIPPSQEDLRLLTGKGRFSDDFHIEDKPTP